jgi:hypothetical protein
VLAGSHLQVDVGVRNAEVAEEDITHELVVVLAGVHDHVIGPAAEGTGDRGELHELGAGTDDAQNTHHSIVDFRSSEDAAAVPRTSPDTLEPCPAIHPNAAS